MIYNTNTCVTSACKYSMIFPVSSAVEQATVNRKVVGSNPTRGAILNLKRTIVFGLFFCNLDTHACACIKRYLEYKVVGNITPTMKFCLVVFC